MFVGPLDSAGPLRGFLRCMEAEDEAAVTWRVLLEHMSAVRSYRPASCPNQHIQRCSDEEVQVESQREANWSIGSVKSFEATSRDVEARGSMADVRDRKSTAAFPVCRVSWLPDAV